MSSQENCYSDEEIREPIERFTSADLPILSTPSPFHSEDSSSGSDSPSGNQIMNLAILAQVFIQLNCPNKACRGRLHLYEHPLQDGLQKFLLLKCGICHKIAAEFPASSPIGLPAEACVNNTALRVRGQSELNVRSLLAVHSTSQSWEDFRLTCSLLGLDVPTAAMSQL